jgi:hypothetical protein
VSDWWIYCYDAHADEDFQVCVPEEVAARAASQGAVVRPTLFPSRNVKVRDLTPDKRKQITGDLVWRIIR